MTEIDIRVPFDLDERDRLCRALANSQDADRIARLAAKAGALEALDCATGRAVPTTLADLRTHRVYCLLRAGMTVGEAESVVAALLKVPSSSARRMVQAAFARFAVELSDDLRLSVQNTLNAALWDDEDERWHVQIPIALVREWLLDRSRLSDKANPARARGCVWRFPDETYQYLRGLADLNPKSKP